MKRLATAVGFTAVLLINASNAGAAEPPPRTMRAVLPDAASSQVGIRAASPDGRRVYFAAGKVPGTGDTSTQSDIYEAGPAGIRLISAGVEASRTPGFESVSDNGDHVLFYTTGRLLPDLDKDDEYDAYDRRPDGSLEMVTSATLNSSSAYTQVSADGKHIYVSTTERLTEDDADDKYDVFERTGPQTYRLISRGEADTAFLWRAAADGSKVVYGVGDSAIRLVEAAGDQQRDLMPAGVTVSDGPYYVSRDASTMLIATRSRLVDADTDDTRDEYVRTSDGRFILLPPDTDGADLDNETFSDDASRMLFETSTSLDTRDHDTEEDTYMLNIPDGSIELLSGTGATDASAEALSGDGRAAFFTTSSSLTADDTDTADDVYEWRADGLRLVSGGVDRSVTGVATASDGSHVVFADGDGGRLFEVAWATPAFSGLSATTVAGEPAVGRTLTCNPGDVGGEGMTVSQSWLRDGAEVGTGFSYAVTAADAGRSITCRATAANTIGSAIQDSAAVRVDQPRGPAEPAAQLDRAAPAARLTLPVCSKAARRKAGACKRFRARASSWRTIRGTVSDKAPGSGVRDVRITIARKAGKTKCQAFNGKRFANAPCDTPPLVKAKRRGDKWSVAVGSLRAGTYTLTIRARDNAGNEQRPVRKVLRLK